LETLAIQTYYMQPLLEDTHAYLSQMSHHFHMIAANVNEVELYDHSIHMNENLFQNYFNMSLGLATELNYLDVVDEELEKMLEQ